jgi:hypothetical protein
MKRTSMWTLTLLVLLGMASAAPASGQQCASMTDGNRSLLVASPQEQGPVCLATDINPVPAPTEICNCDTNADCKAICGDAGGYCGIYLACPIPPYEHVGSCFCGRKVTSPAG